MLSSYVVERPEDWDRFLPCVTFAYNTSRHESTGHSPYMLIFGRKAKLLIEPLQPNDLTQETEANQDFADNLKQTLHKMRVLAKSAVEKAQIRQQNGYNQRKQATESNMTGFFVNQLVLLHNDRKPGKFGKRWLGPYKIIHIRPPNATIQELDNANKTRLVHLDKLRIYHHGIETLQTTKD